MDLGVSRKLSSLALVVALTACGGGGGSIPPEPVALPTALTLTLPAAAQADASLNFTSSAAALPGLRYGWDFGDGGSSSQASPSHTYSQAGDFDVKLVISNEAGQSIEQKTRLSVERTAGLAGLDCSAANARGWCWLQPKPNGNLRYNMSFSDAQTGWIAGDDGQIWKTVDSGSSWTQQSSGIHQSLRQVVFGGAQRGWALGAANDAFTLWATENGGQSWQPLNNFSTTVAATSTNYSGASLSWLGGESVQVDSYSQPGKYLFWSTSRSTDGGKTWNMIDSNTGQATPGGIRWRFEQRWDTEYGGFVAHGSVQRSLDGGVNWETVLPLPDTTTGGISLAGEDTVLVWSWRQQGLNSPVEPQSNQYHLSRDRGLTWRAYAVPESTGASGGLSPSGVLWMTQGGSLFRSEDFGASWHAVTAPGGVVALPSRLEQGAYWMWPASGADTAQVSFDEGLTWSSVRYPESGATGSTLRQTGARQFLLQSASTGAIYVSSDGGQTWRNSLGPMQAWSPVLAFQALDGQRWLRQDRSSLQRTADAGRTWQKVFDSAVADSARFNFVSSNRGWLCRDGSYQATRDGGQTWADVNRPGAGCNLVFASEQHGWAFVTTNGTQSVLETKDGGASWSEAVGSLSQYISMGVAQSLSDTELVIGASQQILLSTDAGKTWRQTLKLEEGDVRTLVRAGARDLWATGARNQVWRSVDGGATWARINMPGPDNAVWGAAFFLDARRGWLDRGEVLRTEDGGQTWAVQPTGSSMAASGLQFLDAKTGWLWGTHGLLMTGSGGQ